MPSFLGIRKAGQVKKKRRKKRAGKISVRKVKKSWAREKIEALAERSSRFSSKPRTVSITSEGEKEEGTS